MTSDPLLFLVIDDSPGRYEEFFRLLDDKGHRWVQTHDLELAALLEPHADVILLDHDMPVADGRVRARSLSQTGRRTPVVITSTTALVGAREQMVETLRAGRVPVLLCPADHHNCEIEWLSWSLGATEHRGDG